MPGATYFSRCGLSSPQTKNPCPPNSESSPSCPRGPPPLCLFALRAGASAEPTHRESPFSALFPAEYQATRQHANATRRQSTRFTDYRPRRRIGSPSETVDQPRAGRKPPSWNRRDKRRGIAHQHNPPRDMRANRIICTLSAFCRQNPMAQTVTHLKLSNNNRKARGKACAMGYELSRRGKQ